jgi:hypothetical protein
MFDDALRALPEHELDFQAIGEAGGGDRVFARLPEAKRDRRVQSF